MVSTTAVRSAVSQEEPPRLLSGVSYDAASRLMDSLLHDARNPLNAIAIHLEILREKLKDENGVVAPAYEKNLQAMREQVFRVDGILRQFSEFVAPRPGPGGPVNLSDILAKVREVVGHELRKRRIGVRWSLEPGVVVRCNDSAALHLLALYPVLRALPRAGPGGEVAVTLTRDGPSAWLRVGEPGGPTPEPSAEVASALAMLGVQAGAQVRISPGECELSLALA